MHKRELLSIFLTVFIDLVGFGIVIPILPYYAQEYGASGWEIGWLMASYSLMQFIFAPVWGRISDFIGRKPVLLISILGTSLSMAVLGFAGSLEWLFIGRIAAGICGGNISTAYAYVADVTDESHRARGMGLIGAAFGLGFIFGPALGGLLSTRGYEFPMFAGSALALFNFVLAIFILKERRLPPEVRARHRSKRFSMESVRAVVTRPAAAMPIALFFLVTFAVTQMEVVFAIYMKARYGFNAFEAGIVLAATGMVMVAVQGGLIGRLAYRYGEKNLVPAGAVFGALGLLVFALTRSVTVAVIALTVMALGHGLLHPSLSSLTSMGADSDKRGMTMGMFHSASSLARVLGPLLAGWLYDTMSWRSPFLAASAVLMGVCMLALIWKLVSSDGPASTAASDLAARYRRRSPERG